MKIEEKQNTLKFIISEITPVVFGIKTKLQALFSMNFLSLLCLQHSKFLCKQKQAQK